MIMYGSMNLYRTNSKIDDFKFRWVLDGEEKNTEIFQDK